jgi:hypothetical protein
MHCSLVIYRRFSLCAVGSYCSCASVCSSISFLFLRYLIWSWSLSLIWQVLHRQRCHDSTGGHFLLPDGPHNAFERGHMYSEVSMKEHLHSLEYDCQQSRCRVSVDCHHISDSRSETANVLLVAHHRYVLLLTSAMSLVRFV